uniref:Uncharacterized protein n=1 Tax=Phasianus colchicus TaxID=9054 RepID=A0A669R072_PHACC
MRQGVPAGGGRTRGAGTDAGSRPPGARRCRGRASRGRRVPAEGRRPPLCSAPRPPPRLRHPREGGGSGRTGAASPARGAAGGVSGRSAGAEPGDKGERDAAVAMGEQLRAQPAAATGAPPAASCSLRGGLLHNGFHPAGPTLSNGGCGEAPHSLLLRPEPPPLGHGSPAKKCRLRRRMDSGRRHRPRNRAGRSEGPRWRPMRRRRQGTAPPCANGAAAGGERRPGTNAGGRHPRSQAATRQQGPAGRAASRTLP